MAYTFSVYDLDVEFIVYNELPQIRSHFQVHYFCQDTFKVQTLKAKTESSHFWRSSVTEIDAKKYFYAKKSYIVNVQPVPRYVVVGHGEHVEAVFAKISQFKFRENGLYGVTKTL